MDSDFFGNILDHHWTELINSLVEKIDLPPNDGLAHLHDDVLALFDVLHQLNGGFELVLNVVLHFLVEDILFEHLPVGRAQTELRHFVFVVHHRVLIPDLHNKDVRLNVAGLVLVVFLAWTRVESLDELDSRHDFFQRLPDALGDFAVLLVLQLVEVIADNVHGNRVLFNIAFIIEDTKLDQQAFAQIASSHSGWIEALHNSEGLLDVFEKMSSTLRD